MVTTAVLSAIALMAIGFGLAGTRTATRTKVVTDTTAVVALQGKVSGLQAQLNSADRQVTQLQPQLAAANQRIGQLVTQLTTTNQRAGQLQSQLGTADQRISQLQSQANSVLAQKRQNEALAAELRQEEQQLINHSDKGLVAQQVMVKADQAGNISGTARVLNTTPFLVITNVTVTLIKGGQAAGTATGVVTGAAQGQTVSVALASQDKMPTAYDGWSFQVNLWQ